MANLGAIGAGGSVNAGSTNARTPGPGIFHADSLVLVGGVKEQIFNVAPFTLSGDVAFSDQMSGTLDPPEEGL